MYERHRDPWITFRYPDRIRFDAWTLARDGIRGEQRRRRCCSNDYIGIRKRNYRNYYHHRESVWAGSRRCSYSRWRKRRWLQRQLRRNGNSIWYGVSVYDNFRLRCRSWRDCAITVGGDDRIGVRGRWYRDCHDHGKPRTCSRSCGYNRWRKRPWLQWQLPRNGDSLWDDLSVCDRARSRSEYWRDCAISPFGRLPLFCCVDYKQCRRELELVEYPRLHHQSELSADRSAALGMEQLVGRFRPFVSSGLSPGNLGTRRHSGNP